MPMDQKLFTIRFENLEDIFDQSAQERETLNGPRVNVQKFIEKLHSISSHLPPRVDMTEVSLSGSQTRADIQKSKWIAVDDMDPGEQEKRQKTQKYMDDDLARNLYSVERMRLRTFLVDLNPE